MIVGAHYQFIAKNGDYKGALVEVIEALEYSFVAKIIDRCGTLLSYKQCTAGITISFAKTPEWQLVQQSQEKNIWLSLEKRLEEAQ